MNIKQYLESKLSEIYYSNTGDDYDEYLNYENDAEEILQSILKAIEEEIYKMEKDIHDRRTYLSLIKDLLDTKV